MIRMLSLRGLAVGLVAACATLAAAPAAQAGPTGALSPLTAVTGQGTGMVIVSPTSAGQGSFVAQVKVNIHDAAPNTTFAITRAVAAPNTGCANPTPFIQVATLTTSAGGAGAVEFERGGRGTGPNQSFDLILQLNGSDGTVLQSQCMTIIGKPRPPRHEPEGVTPNGPGRPATRSRATAANPPELSDRDQAPGHLAVYCSRSPGLPVGVIPARCERLG